MSTMGKVEVNKVAINLRILKLSRFYQMFDPNSPQFLNRNIYQVLCIVFTAITLCVLLFGYVGMFTNKDETLRDIELLLLIFSHITCYIGVLKFCVFLYNANAVWDLFDVARLDFLKSKQCRKHINLLYDCRDWIIKATNSSIFVILVICIQWMLVPLVINTFDDTLNSRKQNAINFRFPVSIQMYNQYYFMFYIIELMFISYGTYALVIIDILIMSFCWVVIILYQILTKSFADVGYANKPQSEHYEDFKSILSDQIQLNLKLKSFYDIIRPIMLIYVGLTSCLIIIMTCVIITICSSLESYSALEVLKLGSTTAFVYFEIFFFCFLFDCINTDRDSVNFGMYSSNWTMMDLKFKKLLLLAMRMNDANQIILKAFPYKIINLQLFANVMKICYNISSVMLKTMKNKQE